TARHASGELSPFVCDLEIQLGTRLSGWVAANRQTIVNSDPVLDLGEIATSGAQRLRSCLSAALVSNDTLIGVLSLYSTSDNFSDDHRRIVEAVARHIARTCHRAAQSGRNAKGDPATGFCL